MRILLLCGLIMAVSGCHQVSDPDFADNPVVAHRGSWKNAGLPMNSLAAFDLALRQEYGGVKIDLQMTADSVTVVTHELTHGGLPVQESTYSELNRVKMPNGEDLPVLEHFLERAIQQESTRVFLQITEPEHDRAWADATAAKVVELVRAHNAEPWVYYLSFDFAVLKEVQRIDPAARVMYLTGSRSPDVTHNDGFYGMAYHYAIFRSLENWVAEARTLGLGLFVWTVNDPLNMVWFLNRRFEFICTDEPEGLMEIYQQHI